MPDMLVSVNWLRNKMELEVRIENDGTFLFVDGQKGSKITVEEGVLIAFVPPTFVTTKDPGFWGRACARLNEKNAKLKMALQKLSQLAATTGIPPKGELKVAIEVANKLSSYP